MEVGTGAGAADTGAGEGYTFRRAGSMSHDGERRGELGQPAVETEGSESDPHGSRPVRH